MRRLILLLCILVFAASVALAESVMLSRVDYTIQAGETGDDSVLWADTGAWHNFGVHASVDFKFSLAAIAQNYYTAWADSITTYAKVVVQTRNTSPSLDNGWVAESPVPVCSTTFTDTLASDVWVVADTTVDGIKYGPFFRAITSIVEESEVDADSVKTTQYRIQTLYRRSDDGK